MQLFRIIFIIFFAIIIIIPIKSIGDIKNKLPKEFKNISLTQNFEETVKHVNSLLKGKYNNSTYLLFILGQQYLLNNNRKEAKNYFLKSINSGVSYGEDILQFIFLSYNNLSFICMNEKDFSQAIKYADLAINMIESNKLITSDNRFKSKPYYNKAEIFFDNKNYDGSKNYYRKAFSLSEEEASATDWTQLASLFWGEGEKELNSSIKLLIRAENFYPNDPNILFNRGRAHIFQKNFKNALEDFFFVTLVEDGRFPPSLIQETIKYMNSILSKKDENDYFIYYSNGISAKNKKIYDEAKLNLLKVIKINPEATFAYLCLGEISKNNNNFNDALYFFNKVEKYKPNLAYLQLEYAETYYFMKKMKFIEYANRCIKLAPSGKMSDYARKLLENK